MTATPVSFCLCHLGRGNLPPKAAHSLIDGFFSDAVVKNHDKR
jgi:hypothetical protein